MAKFKNVSPLGALELPLVGRVIAPGEVFEVSPRQAKLLAGQEATWAPVRGRVPTGPDPDPNALQGPQGAGADDQDAGAR